MGLRLHLAEVSRRDREQAVPPGQLQPGGTDPRAHWRRRANRRRRAQEGETRGAESKGMTRYIIRRVLWGIALLFIVAALTFVFFYLFPSANPA